MNVEEGSSDFICQRMSSDIISSLQLDKEFEYGRVIVAKEFRGCDSSFITSSILGHTIKNKSPVILVLVHNSLSHYQNVGLRMFYNLKKSIDSGLIDVIDFGAANCNNVLKNEYSNLNSTSSVITDKITKMHEKYGSANVVVDGLSHLFDLQFSLQDVNQFCKQLVTAVRCCSNSFIMFHCNIATDDDVTMVISSLLSHMAHTVLEVESLSSGWSADVSGHLKVTYTARKFDEKYISMMNLKPSQYLFKLFDKGVKLFAPGTV